MTGQPRPSSAAGTAREAAIGALVAIETGTRAAAALDAALQAVELAERDRGFATELVYGTNRMARACDHLLGPHIRRSLDPDVRVALRIGAYQLAWLGVAPHAAVSATVEATPKRARSLVNAVLRRVAHDVAAGVEWPNPAVEHSYPGWLWDLAVSEWGDEGASALVAMNRPERVTPRPDGYRQGQASRWVCEVVDTVGDGGRLLDLCAAPGGKTTGVGPKWAHVVGAELDADRVDTLRRTLDTFRPGASTVRADGTAPPFRAAAFDAVLLDAPCTGYGALGRRSDARWNSDRGAVARLAGVQRSLLEAAAPLVRPGGALVYSVCTFTRDETLEVADSFTALSGFTPMPIPGDQWRDLGTGSIVLPQDHGTDAMAVFAWKRPPSRGLGS